MAHPAHIAQLVAQHPTLGLIGNTPVVEIDLFRDECPDVAIFAKMEAFNPGYSLKDRPVLRMLLEALHDGTLTSGRTILDSSSGNAGIAYAMIGNVLGCPVEIVVPGNASAERKKRIKAHGATLRETDAVLGYDEALREVHRLAAAEPQRYWLCDQYRNEYNWRAHFDTTGEEILAQVPDVTHYVGGVGTGGSITGIGRRLKQHNASIEIVSIVPDLFPGIEGLKSLTEAGDIIPEIYDASVVDRHMDASIDDAFEYCGHLARRGLFVGQSSGAYIKAAHELAREIKRGTIVTVLNDLGERYFSTRLWDDC